MTFEQKDIGGRPFEKPEVREIPITVPVRMEPSIPEPQVLDVRKTSKAPKKAAAKVRGKPNKTAVAHIQKKL